MTLSIVATVTFSGTVVSFAQNTTAEFSSDEVAKAFAKSSGGYSSDEVLINDKLRHAFLNQLAGGEPMSAKGERAALLRLLQLRKAGKLNTRATRRGPKPNPMAGPTSEIAARVVADRHQVSTDTILADRDLRAELQREAEKIDAGVKAYDVRKSILQLRKKRALKPELVLRVAQWDRKIVTVSLADLRRQLREGTVSTNPGVYLFRDDQGYLYVGEASSLAARLKEHVTESDRASLANYLASESAEKVSVELHVFPTDSPARKVTVRRAYESELIRSRKPKFNARP